MSDHRGLPTVEEAMEEIRTKLLVSLWPTVAVVLDVSRSTVYDAAARGEIDVMENVGRAPSSILGSIHGPGYSGAKPVTTAYALPRGRFSEEFHVFAIEWEPQAIRFYVDGDLYATKAPGDLPAGTRWVFDRPFFILLNLAVGGNLPGSPDRSTIFPERMLVDYVRVYSRK